MILWRVKETQRHEKYFVGKIRWRIFLSNFLLLCYYISLLVISRELW
jgi:hypothetical protein